MACRSPISNLCDCTFFCFLFAGRVSFPYNSSLFLPDGLRPSLFSLQSIFSLAARCQFFAVQSFDLSPHIYAFLTPVYPGWTENIFMFVNYKDHLKLWAWNLPYNAIISFSDPMRPCKGEESLVTTVYVCA